ncbi:MAG: putative toxin-antitoxin system toxin component, PIN family [Flavobacteriales bacterium]|jgi:putative PIN family toxin of toxin-antitoxin system|nr:putative toxin-antitoxin system toxin component, PIN family [Flavobacteriales bacterium]MBK7941713.1 putative toxin-antitoxin system toxin component, PIN family [Flavobacteriales bacterium]MBK9700255.1 putative toxin-antitoxin system toxin component, PIN family [Flavobacteriales bacterium]
MQRARQRLVVDTNVLISWLIGKRLRELDVLLVAERFQLCFSTRALAELAEVTRRSKMRKYFTLPRAEENIERLGRVALVLKREPRVIPICRDAKDDFLLALAKAAKADLLVTGDEDLLVLKKYGRTRIVTPGEFLKDHVKA